MNIIKLLAGIAPTLFFLVSCSGSAPVIKLTEERGLHGGVVQKNDLYQVELVVKDEHLKLYVSNLEGNAISPEEVSATAMVSHTTGEVVLDFHDVNSDLLVAHGDFSNDNVKVVILDIDVENTPSDTLIFNLEATAAGLPVAEWEDEDEGH